MNVASDRAQVNFLRWVAQAHPSIYSRHVTPILQGQGRLGRLGWITAVVQAVAAVGSVALQKKQQDKALKAAKTQAKLDAATLEQQARQEAQLRLLELNAQRAAAGKNPVDMNGREIPSASLPAPATLRSFASGGTSQYLPYLLIGGAVVAFAVLRK